MWLTYLEETGSTFKPETTVKQLVVEIEQVVAGLSKV